MEILAERLNAKLREWRPDIAKSVRRHVAEIIDLADQDALDIMRSRTVEQEVLDLLDEFPSFALDLG
jgi:ribose 1,5-bisphosphokinase PhnN